jgi:hypothetical protein
MTLKVAATAVVIVGLLGGTAGATAASAAPRPAALHSYRASASRLPVLYAKIHYGDGKVRPHGLSELLFQDGQFYLTTASWKRWTDKSALSVAGKECSRDAKAYKWTCEPGRQTDFRVRVHHGQRYFSKFRFTYKAKGVHYTIKGHYATTAGGWWDWTITPTP